MRYKNPRLQKAYDGALVAAKMKVRDLFHLDGSQNHGSSVACAFWDGYNQQRSIVSRSRNTVMRAVYEAGKDYRKLETR